MTQPAYDVAIIGAGIVGAACALECAREGMHTVIIEANIIAGGATAAGMGHLVVMDDSEAQFALTRYSQTLWQELAAEMPPDNEYDNMFIVTVYRFGRAKVVKIKYGNVSPVGGGSGTMVPTMVPK